MWDGVLFVYVRSIEPSLLLLVAVAIKWRACSFPSSFEHLAHVLGAESGDLPGGQKVGRRGGFLAVFGIWLKSFSLFIGPFASSIVCFVLDMFVA